MQANEREARQMRWAVWHAAALPLMKRFPKANTFIDPPKANTGPKPKMDGAEIFQAMRGFGGSAPPAWVLEKFRQSQREG
jgi:hypothetical protein